MRFPFGALVAAAACVGPAAAQSPPDAPRPTFRAAVDLVSISAVVTDRRGRPVRDLLADDFIVVDAGVRRHIVDFTAGSSSAVTLAMLVDESGSMRVGAAAETARRVVKAFLGVLADGGAGRDEAALFGFDSAVREVHPFTSELSRVGGSLGALAPFGSTSVYDAIAETARHVAERGWVRRALVVVTDGQDNRSRLSLEEASGLASAIDVPVYVVQVGRPPGVAPPAKRQRGSVSPSTTLEDLARWTGGELIVVGAGDLDARLAAARIVADVRYQYLLAFESAPEAGWRALEVRTTDGRLRVRARGAYMAGGRR